MREPAVTEIEAQELEVEGDDLRAEEERIEVGLAKRSVYTDRTDPTVEGLYGQWKEGDLVLQPEFQRWFVWDKTKCSRLVESILLELPLPMIYLAEDTNAGRLISEVIDGQQRLTACFQYIDGDYALSNLRVLDQLNGTKFKDLPKELQGRIKKCGIRTIKILKESDSNLKFEIFERLNTGAIALNPQELRNCVFRGAYNDLIRTLSEDNEFRATLGIQKPEKRMRDAELVLRFAAFTHATYLGYQSPMKRFLNDDMERFRNISEKDAAALEEKFRKSVFLVRSMLGDHAFRRFYPKDEKNEAEWETKVNLSLFDILMGGFIDYSKNQVMPFLDSLREAYLDLLSNDDEFNDSIELSTSSVKMVRTRFDKWRNVLGAITGSPRTEPRCFSFTLKQDLYHKDPTCRICGQHISQIDDAAVDHIAQYWMGGKTIPENARLVHRYCNQHRPRQNTT